MTQDLDTLFPDEFYLEKPPQFKYGFELPKDVDFTVYLGRHSTAEDFSRADELIVDGQDGHTDLHLVEGPGNQWLDYYFEGLVNGNDLIESELNLLLAKRCPKEFIGHQRALFESIKKKKVTTRVLDAQECDPILAKLRKAWEQTHLSAEDQLKAIEATFARRDFVALHSLKKIVDKAYKPVDGNRRQVVITRGGAHVHFLRALEFQVNNRDKSNGCAIVASVVDFQPVEDHEFETIMEILKISTRY